MRSQDEARQYRIGILLAAAGIAAAALIIFWNLGKGSIDLRDEALTAGRSLYIYHTGSLVNLEVNGELSVRKPPLVYALTALSYKVFGVNELGLRVPNALFGLGVFLVTLWGAWRTAGPLFGGASPWILLGCYNLIRVSREALTDTAFVFGLSLCIISLVVHLNHLEGGTKSGPGSQNRASTYPVLFAVGLATALLSKGFLALYAPAVCLLMLMILERRLVPAYLAASAAGTLPFAVWFAAQAASCSRFVSIYLGQEYLERMDYDSEFLTQFIRPPSYYLTNLWRWFRINGVAALAATIWAAWCMIISIRQAMARPETCSRAGKGLFVAAAGWLGYFLLLSFASHKSRRYILPIFPLMTILASAGFSSLYMSCRKTDCKRAVSAALVLSVAVGLLALKGHYRTVPDYLPERKEAAIKLKPLAEQGYEIYSDDERLAPILHFYLDRIVRIVDDPDELDGGRWVFVTSKTDISGTRALNKEYRMIVHD